LRLNTLKKLNILQRIFKQFTGVLLLGTAILFLSFPAGAKSNSPAGSWKTIDDKTGEPKGVVEIWEEKGVLYGKIIETVEKPKDGKPKICDKCEGALKNAPILGLRIIWNLKKDGSEWNGGWILDPDNGKIYRAKMSLLNDGSELEVRGYIGFSFIGRSQVWKRVE